MNSENLKKKITFIAPFAYPLLTASGRKSGCGGAERQFYFFAQALQERGWQTSFIVKKPADMPAESESKQPLIFADFSYLGGGKWRTLFCWVSIWAAMKKANADYYVLKTPGHLLAPMSFFTRFYHRKLVFWSQMSYDANPEERIEMNRFASWLQNWGTKKSDIVIAQNEQQGRDFQKYFRRSSAVVPSIAADLHSNQNTVKVKKSDVLWVGNSHAKKRFDVLLALAKLTPENTYRVAMNNNNSQFEKVQLQTEQLPNVEFLGTVPSEEMDQYFQSTKLYLNTSTFEGFPNTFLQAWCAAVPVVSLFIDPDQIIENFQLGKVLFSHDSLRKSESASSLAKALKPVIEILLHKTDMRKTMGEKAKEYVQKVHSKDTVVPKLLSVLS